MRAKRLHQIIRSAKLFAALLAVFSPHLIRAELELSPLYSDNMVLQKGVVHEFSGKAAPKAKIKITYQSTHKKISKSTTADSKTGNWDVPLDLKDITDLSPAKIEITESIGTNQTTVTLSNVAIGNVWLLGVLDGSGITADSARVSQLALSDLSRLRYISLTHLESKNTRPLHSGSPLWHPFTQNDSGPRGLTVFSLGMSAELGDGYIGIIQVAPETIARLGQPKVNPRQADLKLRFDQVLASANKKVRAVGDTNRLLRIEAKHEGVVPDLPLPTDYVLSRICLYRDFRFSSEPPCKFEGAIW